MYASRQSPAPGSDTVRPGLGCSGLTGREAKRRAGTAVSRATSIPPMGSPPAALGPQRAGDVAGRADDIGGGRRNQCRFVEGTTGELEGEETQTCVEHGTE